MFSIAKYELHLEYSTIEEQQLFFIPSGLMCFSLTPKITKIGRFNRDYFSPAFAL
jgi:hypothetical protein